MNEAELESILKCLSAALEVFSKRSTPLTAAEITVKSMLMALHSQVEAQLDQERYPWQYDIKITTTKKAGESRPQE